MAKKEEKKGAAKKAVQTAIPRAPQGRKAPQVKFVSFSFGATIPTQAYGNVTPQIVVEAESYEDARDFAIPKITELYKQFADAKPGFLGKITETVKEVVPAASAPIPTTAPAETVAVEAPVAATPKPESVLKAEKAIAALETEESALLIQDKIEKSEKIPKEFKADLLTLCLKKRKELEM